MAAASRIALTVPRFATRACGVRYPAIARQVRELRNA